MPYGIVLKDERRTSNEKRIFNVTAHVVRLKLFRLKAEGVRKALLPHFGGETADFLTPNMVSKFAVSPLFPDSLKPLTYPPE